MEYDYQTRTVFGVSRPEERAAFVRSVYLWLMGGFGVAAVGAFSTPFVLAPLLSLGRFAFLALIIGWFASSMWAQAVSRRRPQNRYAYALFTYLSGVLAGTAMIATAQTSGVNVVFGALVLTAVDFLALSAIAFVTKKDFSFLGSFVMVGLIVAIAASLIGIFYHAEIFHLMISAVIVIACSAKILWDTSRMLQTGDTSDAAGFALSLFISLLNIFLSLLRLLSGGRRS